MSKIQFIYSKESLEAILDRLLTTKIISEGDGGTLIEAEVYGKRIMMWLLSQGEVVEIIKTELVLEEMTDKLTKMLDKYR